MYCNVGSVAWLIGDKQLADELLSQLPGSEKEVHWLQLLFNATARGQTQHED